MPNNELTLSMLTQACEIELQYHLEGCATYGTLSIHGGNAGMLLRALGRDDKELVGLVLAIQAKRAEQQRTEAYNYAAAMQELDAFKRRYGV